MFEGLMKGDKGIWREERGAVTIYLVIIFLALIVLVGLLVDLARIKVAQNQLRRVTNSAARSVLADYDPKLKQDFGLFTYQAQEPTQCQPDFARYVQANLIPSAGQDFQLLSYRVEQAQAILVNPLQPAILKQQILEDMKYTAPLEYTKFVTNVFGALPRMSTFYKKSRANNQLINDSRTKLKEAQGLQVRVNQNGEQLVNQQEQLAQRKQARQQATVPEDKAALQQEIAEIQEEISRLKQQVTTDLNRCTQIADDLQTNQKQIKVTGADGDQIVPATDPKVEDAIRTTEQNLDELVNQITVQNRQSADSLKKGVDASRQALNAGDFQAIGLVEINVPAVEGQAAINDNGLQGDFAKLRDTVVGKKLFEEQDFLSPFSYDTDPEQFEAKHGKDMDKLIEQVQELEATKSGLENFRDEMFINEYALVHFSNITQPIGSESYKFYRSEAEYIAVGGATPRVTVFKNIYLMRTALDTLAYFCFSKFPADPLARGIYSLVMGALQGAVDCYHLALGDTVALAEMKGSMTGNANPLQQIQVTYQDHLRLVLTTKPDEAGKLQRIIEVIQARQNTPAKEYHTMLTGQVQVSIPLWFIPLGGVENLDWGPFGSKIKDGRCCITKEVEYSY